MKAGIKMASVNRPKGSELLSKTLKKRASKNVDTKELNELLEKAKNTLELINLMKQKRTSLVQIQSKKLEDDQDEESKLSKLLSTLQSLLQDMKERIIVSPLSCAEKIPVPVGCGSTITELHPTLQFVANCLEAPSVKLVIRETIDMEEISAEARKLELNSIVKKLETE